METSTSAHRAGLSSGWLGEWWQGRASSANQPAHKCCAGTLGNPETLPLPRVSSVPAQFPWGQSCALPCRPQLTALQGVLRAACCILMSQEHCFAYWKGLPTPCLNLDLHLDTWLQSSSTQQPSISCPTLVSNVHLSPVSKGLYPPTMASSRWFPESSHVGCELGETVIKRLHLPPRK